MLEFSSDDIAKCKRIAITLTKGIVRNKLNFSYGILQEYTTTENNETFTVCKNGYWSYHSDNISIEAPLKSNPVIHIAYSEDEPYNGNLSETIARVTRTINSLKHLFKENKGLEKELVLVRHTGFRNIRYEAIKKYFRFYNIEYMEVPFDNQEFENPLFLRLFCEAFQGESINFTGIDLKTVYEKYLEKMNERISDRCDVNYRYKIVQKTIRAIVAYKFEKNAGNNIISIDESVEIVLEIQQKYSCKTDLLEQLLSEGILTQNVLWNGEEYIYITYERMEDYVYAEMLCEELAKMSIEEFRKKYCYILELVYNLFFITNLGSAQLSNLLWCTEK